MAIKRIVSTSYWDDDLVVDNFTPEDKYFMLYLLTNQYTSQLGIYHLPIKKCALDMGYSEETVRGLIDRFENKYQLIKFSKETNEVAIKNYLRHSIIKGGKPVMDCLLKEEKAVKDKSLIDYVVNHLKQYVNEDTLNNTVLDYIKHIINEKDNDNDNDNDNERYVDVSYHDSLPKRFVPPSVEEVKAYCDERNNGIDAEDFVDFYQSKGWMVGKNKMKDWKSSVRTWERKRGYKPTNNKPKKEIETKSVDYSGLWSDEDE